VSDMNSRSIPLVAMVVLLTVAWLAAAPSRAATEVRLYALDCGHAMFKDMGMFSSGAA
jgi:hypothetical protein